MNQGYEVVEYIQGNEVKPADHELIAAKFEVLPGDMEVDDVLSLMQERIPVFEHVNALQFREIILDSNVHSLKKATSFSRETIIPIVFILFMKVMLK